MSYIESNLIPGEQVLYKTGLHWVVLVGPVLLAIFLGLPGLLLLIVSLANIRDKSTGGMGPAGFVLLIVAGLCMLLGHLQRRATEMTVTNKRILIKTGLLSRKTIELLLSKVESIGVQEGLLGRMLGYGSVVVRGTGGTPEPFSTIAHPLEFRRQVQQQIERREEHRAAQFSSPTHMSG